MATINGTSSADTLVGGNEDDTISGFASDDSLKGGRGNDSLFGGSGNDTLISGFRDPILVEYWPTFPFGEPFTGTTPLDGGNDDFMSGGSGNDRLIVSFDTRNVKVDGGADNDTLQIGMSDAVVQEMVDAFPSVFQTDPDLFTAFVNLATGTGSYRFNGHLLDLDLVIEDIENVDGTVFSETITGTSGANILEGDGGNDTLIGGGGADTLDGGVGRDRAIYDLSAAIDIDLNRTTQIGGEAQGDRLISVEDIDGSRNSDVIRGSSVANELWGNLGNDFLEGRGGADIIDGGAGIDTAAYEFSGGGVTVGLDGSGTFGQDAQGDILISIENLIGFNYNDTLTGSAGDNVLKGGVGNDSLRGLAGNDILDGGVGADTIDGGADTDKVTYADATAGLQIILGINGADGRATLNAGNFERDILRNIENVDGSDFDDAIFGNEFANVMDGGLGSDYFTDSRGNDRYIGGSGTGIDTLDLAGETAGVTINLATGVMTHTGTTERDTMTGIERVVGTGFADNITGSFQKDFLFGGGNDDTIFGGNDDDLLNGGSGSDTLDGGAGNDTIIGGSGVGFDFLTGGAGADNFQYESRDDSRVINSTVRDNIQDFSVGQDHIDLSALNVSAVNVLVFQFTGTTTGFGVAVDDNGNGAIENGEFAIIVNVVGGGILGLADLIL